MMQMRREESAPAGGAEEEEEVSRRGSLSFRLDSPERISAVDDDSHANDNVDDEIKSDEDDANFEFSFIPIPDSGSPIAADDVFSEGKIRPVYPVFNRDLLKDVEEEEEEEDQEDQTLKPTTRASLRRLFIEEERDRAASFSSSSSSSSSISSSVDELDGVPEGTYCVWTPNKERRDRRKKSMSTGSSMSFRLRIRDLVVGRSQSDGKEKFVFIPIKQKEEGSSGGDCSNSSKEKEEEGGGSNSEKEPKKKLWKVVGKSLPRLLADGDLATPEQPIRKQHGQDAGNKGLASARKSYLPYKTDVVGFFASANGLSRSQHHPL